jgi:two-component system chemotaxis response regulator CheB
VLVVVHIPAHVKSELAAQLQQVTRLPVADAQNGRALEAGHIYVATPDRHLLVTSNSMRLTHAPKESHSRPAIDALFRSAADAFGPRVIGVLLSGMLDDGISGLWAIKDRGGVALVQGDAPETSASMPESAALQVEVDAVVPAQRLGALIGAHVARLVAASGIFSKEASPLNAEAAADRPSTRGQPPGKGAALPMCPTCDNVLIETPNRGAIPVPSRSWRAASAQTLLLDIDDSIEKGLSDTLRAVEERVLLLRQMACTAKDAGSGGLAHDYSTQADNMLSRAEPLREMADDTRLLRPAD